MKTPVWVDCGCALLCITVSQCPCCRQIQAANSRLQIITKLHIKITQKADKWWQRNIKNASETNIFCRNCMRLKQQEESDCRSDASASKKKEKLKQTGREKEERERGQTDKQKKDTEVLQAVVQGGGG